MSSDIEADAGLAAAPDLASERPSAAGTTPRTSGSKRKRVVLSIHDKQQVLQRLEGGEQPIAIARAFGISRQQVSDIKKNKERIVAFCSDAKHMSTLKRKTLKATSEFHPGVEQELYRWLIRQRRLGRQVSAEALSTKTTDLFLQYSGEAAPVPFKAAANWLRQFKKAHGIKTLSDDELQQLPEQFEPAMDMARPGDVATPDPDAASSLAVTPPPASYFITPVSHSNVMSHSVGAAMNVLSVTSPAVASTMAPSVTAVPAPMSMDMNAYIQVMGGHGNALQPHVLAVATPVPPMQAMANTAQQLHAQLARFDRDMAVKLDYLDERVAKLCYLVLPTTENMR